MVLLKEQYETKELQIVDDAESTSNAEEIAEFLIQKYKLKARKHDKDYLFEGSGGWMDPGEKITFPDDILARFK